MTQYATTSDFALLGLPSDALTGISTPLQDAALVAASAQFDSEGLAAQFTLPLTAWGQDLTAHVCARAAIILLNVDGWQPDNPVNAGWITRAAAADAWIKGVANGTVHPQVTDSSSGAVLGTVYSKCLRGW
jgi:phage gp36-like protein